VSRVVSDAGPSAEWEEFFRARNIELIAPAHSGAAETHLPFEHQQHQGANHA
jgi:hypothetical protein